MAIPLKFTKRAIEKLPVPTSGRISYRDHDESLCVNRSTIRGLQVTVSSTATVPFLLCRKLGGKTKKVTIGRFPEWSVDMARNKALELITEMNRGIDPLKARRAERQQGVTLEQAFNAYFSSPIGAKLAESTLKSYKMVLNTHLADWKLKRMREITTDMIERKHALISKFSPNSANSSMKVLRAVFNYSKSKYKDVSGQPLLAHNPVDHLSEQRLWHKQVRRTTKITDSELSNWFKGLNQLRLSQDPYEVIAASYFELLLFTGLRRTEASFLRIEDVNFAEGTFTLYRTKNGKSLTLPMSDHIEDLLKKSCGNRQSGYVFEGSRPCKHINEPRRELDLLRAHSGLQFSCHDLRRTFISIAESLDISEFAIKQLINHSPGSSVTAGYVIMDLSRIRVPLQRITDHILYHSQLTL